VTSAEKPKLSPNKISSKLNDQLLLNDIVQQSVHPRKLEGFPRTLADVPIERIRAVEQLLGNTFLVVVPKCGVPF